MNGFFLPNKNNTTNEEKRISPYSKGARHNQARLKPMEEWEENNKHKYSWCFHYEEYYKYITCALKVIIYTQFKFTFNCLVARVCGFSKNRQQAFFLIQKLIKRRKSEYQRIGSIGIIMRCFNTKIKEFPLDMKCFVRCNH